LQSEGWSLFPLENAGNQVAELRNLLTDKCSV